MAGTTNRYGIYATDHTKFGGKIYLSDFETDYKRKSNTNGSTIAQRIMSDHRFDEQCRKNIEARRKNNLHKNDF